MAEQGSATEKIMALHKHRGAAKVAARKRLQRAEGLSAEADKARKAARGPASAGAKKKVKRN